MTTRWQQLNSSSICSSPPIWVKVTFDYGPILSLQPKPHYRWSLVLVSKFWQDDEGPGRKKSFPRVPPNRIQRREPTVLACLWRLKERAEQKSHWRKGQNDIWRLHFDTITKRGKKLANIDLSFLTPRVNLKALLSKSGSAWGVCGQARRLLRGENGDPLWGSPCICVWRLDFLAVLWSFVSGWLCGSLIASQN